MITDLEIQNFQSHKYSSVALSSGVNVITGSSDSGKSAIIRAMKWLFFNRPSGDEFKSWFAGTKDNVSVAAQFSEGTWVQKVRDNTKGYYLIEGDKFEALRTDVPDEIKQITNIGELNFQAAADKQDQHNPYFFLNDTAGEVARRLNAMVDLDVIDTMFRNIRSWSTQTKIKINDLNKAIDQKEMQVEDRKYIDAQISLMETIDAETLLYNNLMGKVCSLESIHERLTTIEIQKQVESDFLKIEPSYLDLMNNYALMTVIVKKWRTLYALENSITKVVDQKESEKLFLEAEVPLVEIRSLEKEYANMVEEFSQLASLIHLTDDVHVSIRHYKTEYEMKKGMVKKMMRDFKICPVCQSEITDTTIQNIMEKI